MPGRQREGRRDGRKEGEVGREGDRKKAGRENVNGEGWG